MGSEWKHVKIEEVAEKVGIGPFGSSIKVETFVNEGVPIINGHYLHGIRLQDKEFNFISEEHAERLKNANVKRGDIVFTHRGTIGQVSIIPEKSRYKRYIISQSQFFIRCNLELLLPDFLVYFFNSSIGQYRLLANTSQVGVPAIAQPVSTIKQLEVPLPPLPEQRAIAHILGTLDDKIELNRRMNQTLEEMARALFKSWFVDFDPVRAKAEGRETGLPEEIAALFPDEFEDSELGEVPLNWPIEELGAQLDVLETGRRPKGGVGSFLEGVPSVGAESILGVGLFDYEKTKYITEDFFVSMRSGRAESMDVMLYKDGGKPGDFRPRVSMFGRKFPFERFAINEHVFRIRSKILGQSFLYLQLSHERILNDLHNRGGKAAIPGINQAEVKTLRLPIPPREVLSRFNEIVTPMMESILDRAVQSRTLASLRDTLLPKLISGELRIEDAEKFVEASGA